MERFSSWTLRRKNLCLLVLIQSQLTLGTLGIHKKKAFEDACVCVFVFDILYLDGKSFLHEPLSTRRKILEQHVKEIPNRVQLSDQRLFEDVESLGQLMTQVMEEGLEGLMIKDVKSVYQPAARHWLKMKKVFNNRLLRKGLSPRNGRFSGLVGLGSLFWNRNERRFDVCLFDGLL